MMKANQPGGSADRACQRFVILLTYFILTVSFTGMLIATLVFGVSVSSVLPTRLAAS